MAICGIYKIENDITGEVYIGQSIDIMTRWSQHKCSNNSLLWRKMFEYGFRNFSHSILERTSKEELNDREYFWINKFNSIYPNGYNLRSVTPSKDYRHKKIMLLFNHFVLEEVDIRCINYVDKKIDRAFCLIPSEAKIFLVAYIHILKKFNLHLF